MLVIREKEFQQLTTYIKNKFGLNLSHKKKLIEGRLSNYIREMGYQEFGEYFDNLLANPSSHEISNLINRLTTNHTFFMREKSHFDYLNTVVLPEITQSVKCRDIGIWSAGCSSGEEPYTIAMLLQDHFDTEKPLWDTKILATDISAKALDAANKGMYSSEAVQMLPGHWKNRYFEKNSTGEYTVSLKIKNEVIFRSFNLMQEVFPFKRKFHVIFCRNVMIYFDKETKDKLIHRFYEHTEQGGYLFVGHSESLGRENNPFTSVKPSVYRKQ